MPPFRNAITALRPRTSKRRMLLPQPLLRAVAVACIALLGAASGRALLPGLCANLLHAPLPSIPVYGADSVLAAKRPCCTTATKPYCDPAGHGAGAPRIPALAACAFCALTATPAEALEQVSLPAPGITRFAPFLSLHSTGPRKHRPAQRLGRAPPVNAASHPAASIA